MNCRARIALVFLLGVFGATAAAAQVNYQPTATPTITAENESWYLAGEPVMFNGNVYYPAGPQVHFRNYEMVRTGSYRGIPLYSRTTIEPYSIVFVPLGGGLMQPYERRRSGDLAGTVGSTTPSFPTTRSFETSPDFVPSPQAPAPPTLTAPAMPVTPAATEPPVELTVPAVPSAPAAPPAAPVGTAGRTPPRVGMQTIPRATGNNGIYIDFRGTRWYSDGAAVELDPRTMQSIGEYHGFPVYAKGSGEGATIYVPVTRQAGGLVAGYSRKPRR